MRPPRTHLPDRTLLAALLCAGLLSSSSVGWGQVTPTSTASPTATPTPTCASSTTITIAVENLSADSTVTLNVDGELRDSASTCAGPGATSYATTVICNGTGVVRCGTIAGLRPGAWINRVALTVTGSAPQMQAQHAVFLGSGGTGIAVSNVLTWTIYPVTFAITKVTEADLRAQLGAAQTYTGTHPGPALIVFAPGTFPGASAPQTIDLATRVTCPDSPRVAAICLTGSRVVVDALDSTGEPGGVIISAGARAVSLLRIYGADDVLRGLVLQGSTQASLATQADTVSFVGTGAQRNRLEHSIINGPTQGDAVSAESGGGPLAPPSTSNVVDHCEITGSEDRGLKVTSGALVTVRESCVHDNRNGGLQSTLGGHVVALHNLIQHNVPGPSDNAISAGTPGDSGERSTLASTGDLLRFSGGRGIAVVDDADVVLRDGYVSDNQFAGARIETAELGAPAPTAALAGMTLACNRQGGISGSCSLPPGVPPVFCTNDDDCCGTGSGCCVFDAGCADPVRCDAATPLGFGAVIDACAGCTFPAVTLGDAATPGRNALTLNANVFPHAQGSNLDVAAAGLAIQARGNQWEHCGTGASCSIAAITASDVQLASGAHADVTGAIAARAGTPALSAVSVGRPRAGDLVRVFGTSFNAIDGIDCAEALEPVAPCSAENPAVAQQNRSQRNGNRVRLRIPGLMPVSPDIDAVTPTMIAFRMPFDCFAPLTLEVSKRDNTDTRVLGTIPFCDPQGCLGQDDGTPCDDGAFCTVNDVCNAGVCQGAARDCSAAGDQCHDGRCNAATQKCEPVTKPDGASCDDQNGCTTGDACLAGVCTGGAPPTCDDGNPCTDDSCVAPLGCQHLANSAPCEDGDACTTGDVCAASTCQHGASVTCPAFFTCDPEQGCVVGRPGCRRPVLPHRAPFGVRHQTDPSHDAMTWLWGAGAATIKADFGDPLTSTSYALNVYDATGQPVLQASIPAGGICGTRRPKPCWKETLNGFAYKNPALTPDGILRLDLRAGAAKKARIAVQGRGTLLGLPTLPLTPPLKVQLERTDGACWEADYDLSISKNDGRTVKGHGD